MAAVGSVYSYSRRSLVSACERVRGIALAKVGYLFRRHACRIVSQAFVRLKRDVCSNSK
ncbi:protein of unknown function [Aminobacter niigataensis]|nr:protein of unknown function [Aminobacter niigataensis]